MAALQSFTVVIFLSTLSSGRTNLDRSSEGRPYSSGSASKSDYNIPSNSTHLIGDRRLDSPHSTKTPLLLCCSFGEARDQGSCATDNVTAEMVRLIRVRINNSDDQIEISERNFDLHYEDPCDFDWMVPFTLTNFVLQNGSICDEDIHAESSYDAEHYCLYRHPKSNAYLARVCDPFITKSNWEVFCATIIVLIMLAVFIVYSVIPEHKNLHGMLFRSYIGTYGLTAAGVLAMEFTTGSRTNVYLYSFSDITVRYCAGSCAGWLNAMSFNMWRSIRNLRSIDFHNEERVKRKFIGYAIYSWGGPAAALMVVLIPMYYLPHLRNEVLGYNIRLWYCAEVITAAYLFNTIVFIRTSLAIRHHRRDTANLVHGVNKHNAIDEQSFNLHVKLFVLTGGHIAMWVILLIWPTTTIIHILATLELIQAIVLFVIFVWKDDIRRSFHQTIKDSSHI